MSKLYFSNISEAYNIPSANIKETRNKLELLKKKVSDTAFSDQPEKEQHEYKRIGNPDSVQSTFSKNTTSSQPEEQDLELTFLRLMKNPRFQDVVENYILLKKPEWLLSSNKYVSSKESFGRTTGTTCTDIKHYIIFFVIALSLYLLLTVLLKKN
jgi:hypothetical protein